MKPAASSRDSDDYYIDSETGLLVLTSKYLLRRGRCCKSGCRHCPYPKNDEGQEQAALGPSTDNI